MYTAVIIGATGAGNYGHDLDLSWQLVPEVDVVAVADVDEASARAKADQLGAPQAFGDYRQALASVQPDFVNICNREPHLHGPMIHAAIEAGAKGIYCEKPLVRTPAEADAVIAAASRSGTKIQVAHTWRIDPAVILMRDMLREGEIGRLVAVHATGKNDDRRGGAEDLWVLGVHLMDLMRQVAGDPRQMSGTVLQSGRPIGLPDVHEGNENIGLVAGDQLFATYLFDHGVIGTISSVRTGPGMHRAFGIELVGTEGLLSMRSHGQRGRELLINRRSGRRSRGRQHLGRRAGAGPGRRRHWRHRRHRPRTPARANLHDPGPAPGREREPPPRLRRHRRPLDGRNGARRPRSRPHSANRPLPPPGPRQPPTRRGGRWRWRTSRPLRGSR